MGNLTVKFAKPYKFEGTEYDEVNLSGMDGMTIQDMIDIQKKLAGEIATLAAVEATTSFAQEVATKASGKPVEFFKLMPRAKIKQVQTEILNNLNAKVKNDPKTHVVKFDNAYTYNGDSKEDIKGKTFESVDLSGVGELNTMSESMAENRMVAGGFSPVNTAATTCTSASSPAWAPATRRISSPVCRCARPQSCVTLWTLIFSSKRRSKGTEKSSDPAVHCDAL